MGKTLGEALLAPTRIYVKALRSVKECRCDALRHAATSQAVVSMRIFRECFQMEHRLLSRKTVMKYRLSSRLLAKEGKIEEQMMYNTFNMGIGMVLAVDPADVEKTMAAIERQRRHSHM